MTIANITALINARTNGGSNPISTERDLWNILKNECCKLYEVKELDVPSASFTAFLTANFDNTGLGINDYLGYAICNGQNGTRNRNGLTSIGYGVDYLTIGATGGSSNAVIVSHSHNVTTQLYDSRGNDGNHAAQSSTDSASTTISISTDVVGESGVGKNMQPYIVTLMIQRIA